MLKFYGLKFITFRIISLISVFQLKFTKGFVCPMLNDTLELYDAIPCFSHFKLESLPQIIILYEDKGIMTAFSLCVPSSI